MTKTWAGFASISEHDGKNWGCYDPQKLDFKCFFIANMLKWEETSSGKKNALWKLEKNFAVGNEA